MTVIINDKHGTTIAILNVPNFDDKFAGHASMPENEAWRWQTVDHHIGEIVAVFGLIAFDYNVETVFGPIDALDGVAPIVPDDADTVTYTLPIAFDKDTLLDSLGYCHQYYQERSDF